MVAKNENQMNGGSDVIVTGIKEVPITQERPPALDLDNFVKNPGVARVNVAPSKEKPEGIFSCISYIRHRAANASPAAVQRSPVHITACTCTASALRTHLDLRLCFEGGDSPRNRTVLQQHCDFWDEDKDGVIYPLDTYRSGFSAIVSMFVILHGLLTYLVLLAGSEGLVACRGFRKIGGPIWMSALAVPIIHLTFAYWTQDSWIPSPALGIFTKNIHRVCAAVRDLGSKQYDDRHVPHDCMQSACKAVDRG